MRESALKLMEVLCAGFFSNLGGNELSNTTSALMAAAGIVRGYLNYVLTSNTADFKRQN